MGSDHLVTPFEQKKNNICSRGIFKMMAVTTYTGSISALKNKDSNRSQQQQAIFIRFRGIVI
jgi:hypothetical protein